MALPATTTKKKTAAKPTSTAAESITAVTLSPSKPSPVFNIDSDVRHLLAGPYEGDSPEAGGGRVIIYDIIINEGGYLPEEAFPRVELERDGIKVKITNYVETKFYSARDLISSLGVSQDSARANAYTSAMATMLAATTTSDSRKYFKGKPQFLVLPEPCNSGTPAVVRYPVPSSGRRVDYRRQNHKQFDSLFICQIIAKRTPAKITTRAKEGQVMTLGQSQSSQESYPSPARGSRSGGGGHGGGGGGGRGGASRKGAGHSHGSKKRKVSPLSPIGSEEEENSNSD